MPLIELTLPAEIGDAWPYLRDPALIRRWFGWDYDGLEHEIDVIFLQEATVDDADHVLQWGDGIQDGDRIELADGGVQTIVRVFRNPPRRASTPSPRAGSPSPTSSASRSSTTVRTAARCA